MMTSKGGRINAYIWDSPHTVHRASSASKQTALDTHLMKGSCSITSYFTYLLQSWWAKHRYLARVNGLFSLSVLLRNQNAVEREVDGYRTAVACGHDRRSSLPNLSHR